MTAAAVARSIAIALDGDAVALGFAPGQPGWSNGSCSVTFCATPTQFFEHLGRLTEEIDPGGEEPRCYDLTVDAVDVGDAGWRIELVDIERVELRRVAELAGLEDPAEALSPTALAAVPLDAALTRIAEALRAIRRAADAAL